MQDSTSAIQPIDFKGTSKFDRAYDALSAGELYPDLGAASKIRASATNKMDTFELLSGRVGKEVEVLKVSSKDLEKSQAVTTAQVTDDTTTTGAIQSMVRSTEAMAKIAKFQNQFGVLHGSVAATMGSIKQLLKG